MNTHGATRVPLSSLYYSHTHNCYLLSPNRAAIPLFPLSTPPMAEPMAVDSNPESGLDFESPFAWGKKRGMGGKKKDVQFYESFSFDGAEYAINDTVCLQSGIGGGEPHIGRLIKIWETRDKSRKVKVQWFFRPAEICKYLVGIEVKPNELFLACGGDGAKGFANVNPLVCFGF